MSDEIKVNSENTPPRKNLATLGQVKDALDKRDKKIDSLKEKTVKEYITPEMFGAVGDGIVNDIESFNNAVAFCKENNLPLVGYGSYKLESLLDLSLINFDLSKATILTDYGITVTSSMKTMKFPVLKSISGVGTGVTILDCNACEIRIEDIEGFEIGLHFKGFSNIGCCYNSTYIKTIRNCKTLLKLSCSNDGWTNENSFYGGRLFYFSNYAHKDEAICIHLLCENTHEITGNKFYSPCLETEFAKQIVMSSGWYNLFVSGRYETSLEKTIFLSKSSRYNTFVGGYGLHKSLISEDDNSYSNIVFSGSGINSNSNECSFTGSNVSGEDYDVYRTLNNGVVRNAINTNSLRFFNSNGEKQMSYVVNGVGYGEKSVLSASSNCSQLFATYDYPIRIANFFLWGNDGKLYGKAFGMPTSATDGTVIFG